MPGRVTLVRPDGSLFEVDASDAPGFAALGYKPESTEAAIARTAAAGREAYYSTPGQKVATGLEGLAAGLTLGGSDYLLDKAGATDFKSRAEHNPGTRLATEITGAILPAVVSGGVAAPAGALMKGAARVGEATGAGRATQALVRGGIEGGGFGFGAELSNASLTGDPLTAESALAGIGWGAVWGGGLSGLMAGVGGKVESVVSGRRATAEKLAKDTEAHGVWATEKYSGVHASVRDAAEQLTAATRTAGDAVEAGFARPVVDRAAETMQSAESALHSVRLRQAGAARNNGGRAAEAAEGGFSAEVRAKAGATGKAGDFSPSVKSAAGNTEFSAATRAAAGGEHAAPVITQSPANVKKALETATKTFRKMMGEATGKKPDWAKVERLSAEFGEHIKGVEGFMGEAMPAYVPFAADAAKTAAKASQQLTQMAAIGNTLKSFPVTAEGFIATSPKQMDKLVAAVDGLAGQSSAEFAGLQAGVKEAIEAFNGHVGAGIIGSPGTQLRGLWENLRAASESPAVAETAKGGVPWLKAAKSGAASVLASAAASSLAPASVGRMGVYFAARQLATAILGIKGAVLGSVTSSAGKWAPKALRAGTRAAPRIEPLKVRLDGTEDKGKKDRSELMTARAEEIRAAAPRIRDQLYKTIAPLGVYHPDLAPAVFETAVKQFSFLLNKLPKDQGQAFSKLKSLWKEDPAQMEKFARYYRVFQDPVGVANDMLAGHVLPEYAEGLREMSPAVFVHMRSEMLLRLSDPAVMAKVSYNDQVQLSLMLDLPLHSSMTPRFIAPQQQMFITRNEKLEMPPQPGAGGGNGGRPSGASSDAQKIGQH